MDVMFVIRINLVRKEQQKLEYLSLQLLINSTSQFPLQSAE